MELLCKPGGYKLRITGNVVISQSPQAAKVIEQNRLINNGVSFDQTLKAEFAKQSDVKISAHAQQRLTERNVTLTKSDQARINTAVDRIEQAGADKSLVLMDNLALVVSAKNRVVITALDSKSAKDGVFTNIDSAVII